MISWIKKKFARKPKPIPAPRSAWDNRPLVRTLDDAFSHVKRDSEASFNDVMQAAVILQSTSDDSTPTVPKDYAPSHDISYDYHSRRSAYDDSPSTSHSSHSHSSSDSYNSWSSDSSSSWSD